MPLLQLYSHIGPSATTTQPLESHIIRSIVIVPTYNERENLPSLIAAVLVVAPDADILVGDDNSPDGTGELTGSLAASTSRVRVLYRAGKQGLGTAHLAGFKYALAHDYARIVEMDADFSHRPEDLPTLRRAAEQADVIVGSRNIPGSHAENRSPLRHLISKGGSLYARTLLDLPIKPTKDCTGGFKCFRREALEVIDLDGVASNGYDFQVEMNYLCHRVGLRLVEVPIIFPDHTVDHSKMSLRIMLETVMLVWRLRRRHRPVLVHVSGSSDAWSAEPLTETVELIPSYTGVMEGSHT